MQQRNEHSDVVVIGGGLAGVCAAVAAARLGASVSLITNRPVLGGNSSSEIRVWVVGATAHGTQRFARETGIMGELFLENQYRNPEGNPYYWDQVVLDLVRAEPNIRLHLNTDVRGLQLSEGGPDRTISSVSGWTMGSEIDWTFSAPVFLDCTGDGLVGELAGASYRIGRESAVEFGEPWAPEQADRELLGSSIFFYTKDAGRPERFIPPSITRDITKTPIVQNRVIRTGDNGCSYWWIEWGGELDTVADNERIRDELWGVIFGIWDYIKNSGEFPDADRLSLEWVGSVPGKREYRRFVGDHTLTQHDLLDQRAFDDAVAFGGWSIDLHPVEGVYAERAGAQQRYSNGTYDIPLRSLYSADVSNLLFAGRNISASHIAFGSTRVMATCATQGQAVGTVAALVAARGQAPRELAGGQLEVVRRTLGREDAPVIGLRLDDPDDLAQRAAISASSELRTLSTFGLLDGDVLPLDRDLALVIPVDPELTSVRVGVRAEVAARLDAELWSTGKPQNYVPVDVVCRDQQRVVAGDDDVIFELPWRPDQPGNAVLVLRAVEGVSLLRTAGHPFGVLTLQAKKASDASFDAHIPDEEGQLVTDWPARGLRGSAFAVEASPATEVYRADRVADGYARPFGGPHLWSSALLGDDHDLAAQPESIELRWADAVDVGEVRLVWNDNVDADLINLHHHRTEAVCMPELVADYRIEVADVDGWRPVIEVTDNHHRHRIHDLGAGSVTAMRIVITRTNGSRYVSLSAVRVYAESTGRSLAW